MQTQSIEDIDSVLGRFQAWAGNQNPKKAKPAIRELSYEEALQSSRYRWPGNDRQVTEKKQDTAPRPRTSQRQKASSGIARESVEREVKKIRSRSQAAKSAGEPASRPTLKSSARPESKPVFREALKEAVQSAQIVVAQPAELARQSAISIRLAPSERDLIRARAAEAGITASAYIRQCALEVEQLRTQVRETISALEQGAIPAAPPLVAPPAGLATRIFRKFFPRRAPALALRV